MRNKTTRTTSLIAPIMLAGTLLALLSQTACIQHRNLVNFDTGPSFDSLVAPIEGHSLLIQTDDLLAISVQSQTSDPKITAPFMTVDPLGGAGGTINAPKYLVDFNGKINMPLIGKIPVAGLTTHDARDTLSRYLSQYLKNPIVNVRLSNFRFSVLGEVNNAGTYNVDYERVTLLEALGQAGDLTKYGNRQNILVIRQTNGQRRYGHVNLHQRDVFNSPYFFIEQGDIIYVEPLPAKVGETADRTTKYLQWALPVVSVMGLLLSLLSTGN
ncbi:MAG: hypothetical protein EP344_09165 [Bacteroidetes bacterium]|nr:MAG: hypothetical protein EP344_09165 [Bacteroidota bacterium]